MTMNPKAEYLLVGTIGFLSCALLSVPALAQEPNLQPDIPELKNQTGDILQSAVAGELAVITTTISSNSTEDENFIAMVEARNSIGITELLEFQTGQASSGTIEVGISWTPEEPGEYELRTFLISDLLEPQVLSEVTTKKVTVEE
jgi:hypothetical protein